MHLSTGKMHHIQTDWTDNLIWKSEDRTQLVYPSLCRQDYKDFYWKENPELTTTDSKFLKILQLLRGLFINQKRKTKTRKRNSILFPVNLHDYRFLVVSPDSSRTLKSVWPTFIVTLGRIHVVYFNGVCSSATPFILSL